MRQNNPWMDDTFASSPLQFSSAGQAKPIAQKAQARAESQLSSTSTSENSHNAIPDFGLEDSAEERVPDPPAKRLNPMPADKILFPRRMIYIEAVLYLLIAAASFGMGYLMGRGGGLKSVKQNAPGSAVQNRVAVEGDVKYSSLLGKEQPEANDVVILLPDNKTLDPPIPQAGLLPADPPAGNDSPTVHALTAADGALTRTDEKGHFTLFAPQPGSYHILIISRQVKHEARGEFERLDLKDLRKYFNAPEELLRSNQYKWISRDVKSPMEPIKPSPFSE